MPTPSPEHIDLVQRYLFASEEELEEGNVPAAVRERLFRLRDMYMYWLKHPQYGDKNIVQQIRQQYGITERMAYEDVHFLKICLGTIGQVTRQWCQYVFLQRCEEGFAMARAKNDAGAFSKVLATFARYTRLDKDEQLGPEYDKIVPQQFEISTDPSVAGFERIPNLQERVNKLFARYKREAEQADAEEIKSDQDGDQDSDQENQYHL